MTIQQQAPLDWRIPIVDASGRPTPEFMKKWEQQRSINGVIPDFSSLPAHAVVLGTGEAQPSFVPVGTNGQLLIGQTGAKPAFKSVTGDISVLNTGAVTVTGLQTRAVSSAAPADGEILRWIAGAAQWQPKAEFASFLVIGSDTYTAMPLSLADPEMVLAGGQPVYVKNALIPAVALQTGQPYFHLQATSTTTLPANNTLTKVAFASGTDPTNAWDGVNNRWVPQRAGRYRVTAQLDILTTGAINAFQSLFDLQILKNGGAPILARNAITAQAAIAAAVSENMANASCDVTMNGSTDYIEVWAEVGNGGATGTVENTSSSFFEAHYLGPV